MEKYSNEEIVSNQEQEISYEQSLEIGKKYLSILAVFTGSADQLETINTNEFGDEEGVLSAYESALNDIKKRAERAIESKVTARQLLESNPNFSSKKDLFSDESCFRIEWVSPFLPVVFVRTDILEKIVPGAAAVAVSSTEMPYIILRDENYPGYRDENIAHEGHHILWDYVNPRSRYEKMESERSLEMLAFELYKDELLVRILSDGFPMEYGITSMLTQNKRVLVENRYKDKVIEVEGFVTELNDVLEQIDSKMRNSSMKRKDLLGYVIKARDFTQLKSNLLHALSEVERRYVKDESPFNPLMI